MNSLVRAGRLVRDGGWEAILAKVARGTFPASLLRYNCIRIVSRRFRPEEDVSMVSWATEREIPSLAALRRRGEDFSRFLAEGCRCAYLKVGDDPAAMLWIEPGTVHRSRSNHYQVRFEPDAAWYFGSYVHPRHRGTGLFAHLVAGVMRSLSQSGSVRLLATIDATNARSLRAHEKAGFETLCDLRTLRVLGRTVHACRPTGGELRWRSGELLLRVERDGQRAATRSGSGQRNSDRLTSGVPVPAGPTARSTASTVAEVPPTETISLTAS